MVKSIKTLFISMMAMLCFHQPVHAGSQAETALKEFLGPIATQPIIDQEGRALTPEALAGDVVVVTFFDTQCSILCVGRLIDLAAVAKSLPPTQRGLVKIVALSTAPAEDSPAALQAFAGAMKLDPTTLILASAGSQTTARMLASIGWRAGAAAPDRSPATVFVFDRRGQFALRYSGNPLDRRRLTQDLATLADLDQGVGQAVAEVPSLH